MAVVRRQGKGLNTFLKAGNSAGLLIPAIERNMLAAPAEDRRTDILHPSSMAKSDWCPKQGWHSLKGHVAKTEKNALRRQNIFDEGHAIHDKWQQRAWNLGVLYGRWSCFLCEHENPQWTEYKGWWATSPKTCPVGHPRKFIKYREVPLEDTTTRVGGHSDGWLKGLGIDTMLEIKSVGTGSYRFDAPEMVEQYGSDAMELWKNTRRPFGSHVRQLQIYMHLANLEWGQAAPQRGVFLYESKAHQDYKEFIVPYDYSLVEERFIQAADIVRRIKSNDEPPACPKGPKGCAECRVYGAAAA